MTKEELKTYFEKQKSLGKDAVICYETHTDRIIIGIDIVTYAYIHEGVKAGVICASFHAG